MIQKNLMVLVLIVGFNCFGAEISKFIEDEKIIENVLKLFKKTEKQDLDRECVFCSISFKGSSDNLKRNLLRHIKTHLHENKFQCGTCDKCFSRNDILQRHKKTFVHR